MISHEKKKLCEAQYAWIERQKRVVKRHLCKCVGEKKQLFRAFDVDLLGIHHMIFLLGDLFFLRTNIHFPLFSTFYLLLNNLQSSCFGGQKEEEGEKGLSRFQFHSSPSLLFSHKKEGRKESFPNLSSSILPLFFSSLEEEDLPRARQMS